MHSTREHGTGICKMIIIRGVSRLCRALLLTGINKKVVPVSYQNRITGTDTKNKHTVGRTERGLLAKHRITIKSP
jgi:hypothetical protein